MDVVRGQVSIAQGVLVELAEHITGGTDLAGVPRQLKGIAAIGNLYFQFVFDLSQVLVELPAELGKAAGISRFQLQLMSGNDLVQSGCVIRPSMLEWI